VDRLIAATASDSVRGLLITVKSVLPMARAAGLTSYTLSEAWSGVN